MPSRYILLKTVLHVSSMIGECLWMSYRIEQNLNSIYFKERQQQFLEDFGTNAVILHLYVSKTAQIFFRAIACLASYERWQIP